jgi:hypothetical protein
LFQNYAGSFFIIAPDIARCDEDRGFFVECDGIHRDLHAEKGVRFRFVVGDAGNIHVRACRWLFSVPLQLSVIATDVVQRH